MAGDWIKMRADLHRHPKVVRIASACKADRLRVVGGLHAVWCLFDEHSEDGHVEGYTPEAIDDLIGWSGFSRAVAAVGWLEVSDGYCAMPRFDEHNGKSAKRRAMEAERKRRDRAEEASGQASASHADKKRTREEKRREDVLENTSTTSVVAHEGAGSDQVDPPPPPAAPGPGATLAGRVCFAMRKAGLQDTNPGHPELAVLLEKGIEVETFVAAAAEAVRGGKGFGYAIAIVKRQATDAAKLRETPMATPAAREDIARVTVPGRQGKDPALVALDRDDAQATRPPAEVRAKMAELLGQRPAAQGAA